MKRWITALLGCAVQQLFLHHDGMIVQGRITHGQIILFDASASKALAGRSGWGFWANQPANAFQAARRTGSDQAVIR